MSITQCLAKLSPCLAVITQCLAELSPWLAVINRDFSRVRARIRIHLLKGLLLYLAYMIHRLVFNRKAVLQKQNKTRKTK